MGGSPGKQTGEKSPRQQQSPQEIAKNKLLPDYTARVVGPVLSPDLLVQSRRKKGRSHSWGVTSSKTEIFGDRHEYHLPLPHMKGKKTDTVVKLNQLQEYFSADPNGSAPVRHGKEICRNTLIVVVCVGSDFQFKFHIRDTDNPIYNSTWLKNEFLSKILKKQPRYQATGSFIL